MKSRLMLFLLLSALCFFAQSSYSFTNLASALNSGGGVSSNVSYRSTGSVGVFAAERSSSGSNWSHAGILVSFLLHPGLDFDGDGIPDEDDNDEDNDSLSDSDELTGVRFVPVTATNPFDSDSDDDGASDGYEAVAGTNPDDAASLFRITDIRHESGSIVVVWQGREGISYDLAVSDSLTPPNFSVVSSNITATGGTGAWFQVELSATNTPSSLQLFYKTTIHQ